MEGSGIAVHTCRPSTQEAEVGILLLQVQGQTDLNTDKEAGVAGWGQRHWNEMEKY